MSIFYNFFFFFGFCLHFQLTKQQKTIAIRVVFYHHQHLISDHDCYLCFCAWTAHTHTHRFEHTDHNKIQSKCIQTFSEPFIGFRCWDDSFHFHYCMYINMHIIEISFCRMEQRAKVNKCVLFQREYNINR